jgi:hypothetical protein
MSTLQESDAVVNPAHRASQDSTFSQSNGGERQVSKAGTMTTKVSSLTAESAWANHEYSSDGDSVSLSCMYRWISRKLRFKFVQLEEYRFILRLTFLAQILSMADEIYYTAKLNGKIMNGATDPLSQAFSILAVVSFCLAGVNACLLAKLLLKPTTQFALVSCGVISILVVIYLTQIILYSQTAADTLDSRGIVLTSLLLTINTCSAYVLFNFWDFIMYNYDAEDGDDDGDVGLDQQDVANGASPAMNEAVKAVSAGDGERAFGAV